MAITREKKGEMIDGYVERLRRSQAVIVAEYRGLTVKQLEALRRELRGCDSEMVVTKNTLAARALTAVGQILATTDFPITVEGHTDNVPINSVLFPSNWELSGARAASRISCRPFW